MGYKGPLRRRQYLFFYLIHYENLIQCTKMKLDKYVLINKENVQLKMDEK